MAIFIQGFKELELGEIEADGGASTALTELGKIYEGGVTTETDDPSTTEFKTELGEVIASTAELGSLSLEFQCANIDAATAEDLLGATANAKGGWDLPAFPNGIERTVAVTSDTGNKKFIFARVKLVPKLTGGFNKETPLLISVTGTVLQPIKDGEPIVSMVDAT